ncbi:MAG: hypothetical protein SLAVMIC_00588 [uncultured marine phage]|uniref:Uncharacterized protein n=1 Tax=uncultured marine phage TaxID=707152 RepID=A0A8D9CCH0_9VIRU|nr:MAG: hypothetical protein SLAVMIC_00588 [uncultured marine phage]
MISITGNYMSKYGGLMFINKQEAMDMDIQSLSLAELGIYRVRVVNFIHKKSTRKAEKVILHQRLDETAEQYSEIIMEKAGQLYGDTDNDWLKNPFKK